MGQAIVGGAEGGLSVADRIALLEARQDLIWERALDVQAAAAVAEGDETALLRACAMKRMGLDNYLDMRDIRVAVESEGPTVAATN